MGISSATIIAPSVSVGGTFNTVADVTLDNASATVILAANSERVTALITNKDGNTSTIYVGDSNVSAGRGTPVRVGETLTIPHRDAIYGYVDAADHDVAITYVSN